MGATLSLFFKKKNTRLNSQKINQRCYNLAWT